MITKTNKHQIFFIILSLIVLFGCLGSDGLFLDLIGFGIPINLFDEMHSKNIIFWSLCLIGTLGVSHGAFDGKIIWKHSNKNSPRFKLYTLYILLTLLGAILWFYFPILGLGLLLFLSCIHFGLSDLSFIKGESIVPMISWGFIMTFLPVLFKPLIVHDLFYDLTLVSINTEFFDLIRVAIIINIFLFISYLVFRLSDNKNINKIGLKLTLFELSLLIALAYYLDPLVWFALYFCGLHGLRAILILNFKFIPDILWVIIFSVPIILFIFLTNWNYNLSNLLVIFPVLASLTIAHMLLPKLKNFIKT